MRKLKEILWQKPFCNDWHFLLIACVLLLMTIRYPIAIILLILYLLFIFKKTKYFIPILVIIVIVLLSYGLHLALQKPLESGIYEGIYQVLEVNDNSILVKGNQKLIIYYPNDNYVPGDVLWLKLRVKQLKEASYVGDFDVKQYYFSKGIYNCANMIDSKWQAHHFTLGYLKYYILNFYQVQLGEKSYAYLSTIVFGQNILNEEVKEIYQGLYSAHILAISGLHIMFFYKVVLCIFQKVFLIEGSLLALIVIGFYLLLIQYPLSAIRAYLFLLLSVWNRKGSISYTKLDILSISFIIMIFMNPFWAYQQGFILSFLISFVLVFMDEFVQTKHFILKQFKSSLICILVTLPYMINQNNQVFPLGMLLSFIISFGLSTYLFPFLIVLLMIPLSFFEPIFLGLDNLLLWISKYSFSISVPSMHFYQILIYDVFLILLGITIIVKKKRVLVGLWFGIMLFIQLNFRYYLPFYRITYIDVGQGDSALIESPYQKGTVLIDSFHNISFLKSIGLKKIDVLFLTHFDLDHVETAHEVIDTFHVEKLYYPIFEKDSLPDFYACECYGISANDTIKVGSMKWEVLGPIKDLNESNSNSLVLKLNLNNTTFLWTGDMTEKEEKTLLDKNSSLLKADILKIAHHGSDTSSSYAFLNAVRPDISVISVGKDNSYGLPNLSIVNRLKRISTVYMTRDSGNIEVLVGNQYWVKTYRS